MSKEVRDILRALDEFDRTVPESRGLELRLNLAEIIMRHLRWKGWSQRELALRTSMKESFISRIVHSDTNCTFDTAGKLLFALGVRTRLEEIPQTEEYLIATDSSTPPTMIFKLRQEETNEEEGPRETTWNRTSGITRQLAAEA